MYFIWIFCSTLGSLKIPKYNNEIASIYTFLALYPLIIFAYGKGRPKWDRGNFIIPKTDIFFPARHFFPSRLEYTCIEQHEF